MQLVLASRSPRRRELLALTGLPFRVVVPETDETQRPDENPEDYARRLSQVKAGAAAAMLDEHALVLAADTIVVDGDDVLGKPADAEEAAAMLRRLRGRTHRVMTGVTLLDTGSGRRLTELAISPVPMRNYTDEEIAAYIASGDPFDKAGAYGIQNRDFHPVENFEHCYANVMGLPLCYVTRLLRAFGVEPPVDVAAASEAALGYACPIFHRVLAGEG
ncbi:MAG: Maf family protein [Aggregatilineales bacterium]|nr:Maf family protein [Aggregatilineales bacterium]HPV08068.1 Maf family protein [Aggregatilineales bacterium]